MGGKAVYCSSKCKNSRKREYTLEQKQQWRRNSYKRTKLDPDLYKASLTYGNKIARKTRLWLYNYKLEKGCADCGYKGHPAALQIDHTGPKTGNIGQFRSSVGRMKYEMEIGKCEVRCANCHLVKSWADKNKIEYKPEMVNVFELVVPEPENKDLITDRFGFQKLIDEYKNEQDIFHE